MNNSKKIMTFLVVIALACMPVFAQRNGGNNGTSRSGASVNRSNAPSRSVSSSSSSRNSAPSRSVSSTTRSSSNHRSTISRNSSSNSRNNTVATPRNTSSRNSVGNRVSPRNVTVNRNNSSRNSATRRDNNNGIGQGRGNNPPAPPHIDNGKDGNTRHLSTGELNSTGNRFATPDRPNNPMPPSHRPMHPAPFFHHPHLHVRIHMHPHPWHRAHFVPTCWPGFYHYCSNYWYDYHVTNSVVVTNYVRENYNANLVNYIISGNLMYAIIDDVDGNTYLKVFDSNDNLLAVQEISRRYITMEVDRENGGCWIFKKKGKDPMLFLYIDGELLIYEAD